MSTEQNTIATMVRAFAEIIERQVLRFENQGAEYERKLAEHRASFGARTEADAKIIAGLRQQIETLNREERAAHDARPASPTPKQHPVKVGEWVRRTDMPSDQTPVGFVKQVTAIDCDGERYHFSDGDYWSIDNCEPCKRQHPAQDGQLVRRTVASGTHPVGAMIQIERSRTLHEEYVTRGGRVVPWAHCEPCDQPKATPVMPKPGDMVRLVSRPERDNVDKNLRTALWWPWEDRWGVVGETRKVVAGCRCIPGAVAVAVATGIYVHWPLSCVEVVSEATHDTEAGKAVAESAARHLAPVEVKGVCTSGVSTLHAVRKVPQ